MDMFDFFLSLHLGSASNYFVIDSTLLPQSLKHCRASSIQLPAGVRSIFFWHPSGYTARLSLYILIKFRNTKNGKKISGFLIASDTQFFRTCLLYSELFEPEGNVKERLIFFFSFFRQQIVERKYRRESVHNLYIFSFFFFIFSLLTSEAQDFQIAPVLRYRSSPSSVYRITKGLNVTLSSPLPRRRKLRHKKSKNFLFNINLFLFLFVFSKTFAVSVWSLFEADAKEEWRCRALRWIPNNPKT